MGDVNYSCRQIYGGLRNRVTVSEELCLLPEGGHEPGPAPCAVLELSEVDRAEVRRWKTMADYLADNLSMGDALSGCSYAAWQGWQRTAVASMSSRSSPIDRPQSVHMP